MKNVPHALATRHVKKICDVKRVDQKKGRQTYRNRSERPPPYTPMIQNVHRLLQLRRLIYGSNQIQRCG